MHNYFLAKSIKQFHVLSIEYNSRRLVKYLLLTPNFLIQVLMVVRTADIKVPVSLTLPFQTQLKKIDRVDKNKDRTRNRELVLHCLLGASNPCKLFYQ